MILCNLCNKPTTTRRKTCPSCWTKLRRHRVKLAAIQLLGGKCKRCGWKGHWVGYDFHHTNPESKEFMIGGMANKSWLVVRKELEKCELLCAICHRIEHSNRDDIFTQKALEYTGEMLNMPR